MRILCLENIPTPYTALGFDELGRRPGVSLRVVFCAEREGDRRWHVEHGQHYAVETLPGRRVDIVRGWDTMSFHFNLGVRAALAREPWDVLVVSGWQQPAVWQACWLARRWGRAQVLWAGSTANEKSVLRTLAAPLVRRIVRGSSAYLSYGSAAADYLVELGADRRRVVPAYPNIDNEAFARRLAGSAAEVAALRAAHGLGDDPIVLYVGRLVATKGLADLVTAMGVLAHAHPRARLLIVGDGAERASLEADAARRAPGRVRFTGHVEHDTLAAYYAAADCFVLPSLHEVWGLVINAAALAGLPVVATSACGATRDLVRDGETGLVVAPADAIGLANAIGRILADPRRGKAMGAAGAALVAGIASPTSFADALLHCCELALGRSA